jgi:hypothetical protein
LTITGRAGAVSLTLLAITLLSVARRTGAVLTITLDTLIATCAGAFAAISTTIGCFCRSLRGLGRFGGRQGNNTNLRRDKFFTLLRFLFLFLTFFSLSSGLFTRGLLCSILRSLESCGVTCGGLGLYRCGWCCCGLFGCNGGISPGGAGLLGGFSGHGFGRGCTCRLDDSDSGSILSSSVCCLGAHGGVSRLDDACTRRFHGSIGCCRSFSLYGSVSGRGSVADRARRFFCGAVRVLASTHDNA